MHFTPIYLALGALQSPAATASTGAPAPDLFRYALSLTVVIGLLICALYGIRSWTRNAGRSGRAGRTLEILEALPMGGSKRVCVLRCGERRFLVGLGDKELCALGELGAVEADATPVASADLKTAELTPLAPEMKDSGDGGRFRGLVQRALKSPLTDLATKTQAATQAPSEATIEARKRVADELLSRMTREGHPPIAAPSEGGPQTIERLLREEGLVG